MNESDNADKRSNTTIPAVEGYSDLVEIGRGGFSTVYAATQRDFDRRVALKVLDFSGVEARQIEREARAIGRIADLPNVVQAHQVTTTADGRPVLVMALMPSSLGRVIRTSGHVAPNDVARWAAQLTRALSAAHELDVFHRDIKPENVLISSYGDAHLADFGIAAVSSLQAGTATVQSLSPAHAPPERLAGDPGLDRSGDIYSLASTIYTALTGAAPFGTTTEGGVYGLMERVMNEPLPSNALVEPGVHRILSRAMAKDPSQRYPSVQEFGRDLAVAFGGTVESWANTGEGRIWPPTAVTADEQLVDAADDEDRTRLKVRGPGAPPDRNNSSDGALPSGGPQDTAEGGGRAVGRRRVAAGAAVIVALVIGGVVAVAMTGNDPAAPTSGPPLEASATAGGRSHTCALLVDETVSCWGANWFGQLGSGDPTRPAASAAVVLAASKDDETNVSDEWTSVPVPVPGLKHQRQITAGRNHTCALGEDKRVRCWGSNEFGQLGTPDVGAAESAWRTTPEVVEGLGDVERISAGADFTCALLENRTVACWGVNWDNQLGNPSVPPGMPVDGAASPDLTDAWSATPVPVVGLTSVIAISAGGFHVCALLSDARLVCWGDNGRGQLGSSTVPLSGGGRQARTPTPALVEIEGPVVAVSAGRWHTCAVLEDGTVQCWGENRFGQLGNPRKRGPDDVNSFVSTPVGVVGVTSAIQVSAGGDSTCVLLRDGSAVCFGSDERGQLGSGAEDERPTRWTDAAESLDLEGPVSSVSVATSHACAVAGGAVSCWGANGAGQVGSPADPGGDATRGEAPTAPAPVEISSSPSGS